MKKRLGGVFFLVLGCFLAYMCVFSPLQAADRHEEKVSVSMKGAVLVPFAIIIGVIFLALGDGVEDVLGTRGDRKPLAYVLMVVVLAAGFGLYFWLRSELENRGYIFH